MSAPLLKQWLSVAVLLVLSHTSSALVQTSGRSRRLRSRARATGHHVPIAETKPESTAPKIDHPKKRRSLEEVFAENVAGNMQISDTQIQYFQYCRRELLSEDVLGDGMISQNDFARKLSSFCQEFDVDTVAGHPCPEDRFTSLPAELQLTFAFAVCPAEDGRDAQMECLEKLDSLNGMGSEFGYIVTAETMPEVEYDVEELCFGIFPYIFPPPPTDSPTEAPTTEATEASDSADNGKVLDIGEPEEFDPSNRDFQPPMEEESENGLATGPIVGIAFGGLACLLGGLLIVMRRRDSDIEDDESFNRDKPIGNEYGEDSLYSGRSRDMKVLDGDYSASKHSSRSAASIALGRSSFVQNRAKISAEATLEKINDAIDTANWNEVYTLASEMAEHEDLSTLSSRQSSNRSAAEKKLFKSITYTRRSRTGLSQEDLERTQTLDDLVEINDWTGLAVTAALYAGESASRRGESSQKRSLLDRMTGKRASSRAASAATASESSSIPYGNALGTFTDETKSGSSADGHVDAAANAGSFDMASQTSSAAELSPLRKDFDRAVESADWGRVMELAKAFESNEAYQANIRSNESVASSSAGAGFDDEESCISLHERLNQAVSQSDWSSVNIYATKMNEIYSSKAMSQSTALVPVQPSSLLDDFSLTSIDTNGTGASKKQTIEKLIKAGKWKGASIMAGLYDMEAKGSIAPSDIPETSLTVSTSANGKSSSWATMLPNTSAESSTMTSGKKKAWMGMVGISQDEKSPSKPPQEPPGRSDNAVELRHSDRVTGTIPSMSSTSRQKKQDNQDDDGDSTLISMM